MGTALFTQDYTYDSSSWGDILVLTSASSSPYLNSFSYDSNGCLVADNLWEYYWENGSHLTEMVQYDNITDAYNWTFKYDANGMRTSRRGYNIYLYTYEDGKLIHMESGSGDMDFFYGANGLPTALKFEGAYYYYVTNALGDVVALLNSSGEEVVRYVYDAWGNILSITGSESMRVGEINPLRYRSYVYDREIGLYYLNSRYYNPKIGRFISADNPNYLGADGTPASYNLFAYCNNNPVNMVDPSGKLLIEALIFIGAATLVGAGTGAFIAACKGGDTGDILEGAIEGALSGGAAATIGFFTAPLGPIMGVALTLSGGLAAGVLIDSGVQVVSYAIQNKSLDKFVVDERRLIESGVATALSAVVPTFSGVQTNVTLTIGSAIVGMEASSIIAVISVIVSKLFP